MRRKRVRHVIRGLTPPARLDAEGWVRGLTFSRPDRCGILGPSRPPGRQGRKLQSRTDLTMGTRTLLWVALLLPAAGCQALGGSRRAPPREQPVFRPNNTPPTALGISTPPAPAAAPTILQ